MVDLSPFETRARQWTVRARIMPAEAAGEALVTIASVNGNGEAWPVIGSRMEWVPGFEGPDMEAAGLLLAAERIESLARAFREAARSRVVTGS